MKKKVFDIIGVGVGPFNLSLAALLDKTPEVMACFFDKNERFSWHEDMQLANSNLQVHYLKDLVTLVDPTNKFSFLSYLASQNRIYQFINQKTNTVSRREFSQYYQWVSSQLNNIKYQHNVSSIHYHKEFFEIQTPKKTYFSKNIVIATGLSPQAPQYFSQFQCENIFHSSQYKSRKAPLNFQGKRVTIVGGGQSGAEVFDDILSNEKLPTSVTWVSRRKWFQILDDACFSNELYIPSYVQYFSKLSPEQRINTLGEQKLTSDGITQELADAIYRKIYQLKFVEHVDTEITLLANYSAEHLEKQSGSYKLGLKNMDTKKIFSESTDIIIFATGYRYVLPACLTPIFPGVKDINDLSFNSDYSVSWPHELNNKIFIQNGLGQHFGVADANLSLSAWRNAVIINSLLSREVFVINTDQPIVNTAPTSQASGQSNIKKSLGFSEEEKCLILAGQ